MTGPFYFPRPPKPPGKSNPWVIPTSAANFIAGVAFIFNAGAIGFVFIALTCICFALTIHHARFQP